MGLHPPSLDMCTVHHHLSTTCPFLYNTSSPFGFPLFSILPNQEHAVTMKCYTNDNIIILFLHVDIDVVTLHYHYCDLLTSSLHWNKFTEEGKTQLEEAAAERNRHPDFAKLDLIV